jgi:DNA-binding transcriptional LysR family regulator
VAYATLQRFIQLLLMPLPEGWCGGGGRRLWRGTARRELELAIQRVDLNLFRVFEAIMRHRSVAGAARELAITPSAVSHALARLRQLLDDQLFIAADNGMIPTSRAQKLAPTISEGLLRFSEAVGSKTFDPSRASRTFRIAMSDYATMMFLPCIMDRIRRTGPNINLRIFPLNRLDLVGHLDNGQLEMAVGWFAICRSGCGGCHSRSNSRRWWYVPAIP